MYLSDGLLDSVDGVGNVGVFSFSVGTHEHGPHIAKFADDEGLNKGMAVGWIVVSGGLGKAELSVFSECGSEMPLKFAVAVEEGDFGTL